MSLTYFVSAGFPLVQIVYFLRLGFYSSIPGELSEMKTTVLYTWSSYVGGRAVVCFDRQDEGRGLDPRGG